MVILWVGRSLSRHAGFENPYVQAALGITKIDEMSFTSLFSDVICTIFACTSQMVSYLGSHTTVRMSRTYSVTNGIYEHLLERTNEKMQKILRAASVVLKLLYVKEAQSMMERRCIQIHMLATVQFLK